MSKINKIKLSGTTYELQDISATSAVSGKQDTLISGTNIKTINNESLLGSGNIDIQGGGKAVSGGTNISITTGETADTINCTLPITAGTGSMSVIMGNSSNIASVTSALSLGTVTKAQGQGSAAFGERTETTSNAPYSFTCGGYTITRNWHEFAGGKYNVSNSGSTSSAQTLFSVGNGTAKNARHNAFEIRQNGDIYITSGNTDIKLQDQLGGGGSVTIDPTLDSGSTNAVANSAITTAINTISEAVSGKQDTLVSGTNIKTINNESILGSGNIDIQGGGSSYSAGTGIDITNDVISVTGKVDTSTFNTYSGSVETALSGKQDTLSAGTGISIVDNVISATGGGGGGKAVSGGTNISVTTGETADTINCTLPISAGTSSGSILFGIYNTASGDYSHAEGSSTKAVGYTSHAEGERTSAMTNNCHAEGRMTKASGYNSHAEGFGTVAEGEHSHAEGNSTKVYGNNNHAEGYFTVASGGSGSYWQTASHAEGEHTSALTKASHAEGVRTYTSNEAEHSQGRYNVSTSASTTFGDSGNTLFSVGNGTADNARHNALEIRQNGDIYITSGGTDIKLQDNLGGGGVNVVQTTGTSTTDVMSQDAVTTQLSGYVTTDTLQDITVQKTFVGDPSNSRKSIKFKQYDNASKVGFVVVNSAETNNEVASFEFRPNTFTIDNVQHPLLYFGHYRKTNTAYAGVPQTVIGFRQYDQLNAAAYHYLMPLPEKAKTPFSLTTSFKDYYAPLGFKNGSTMITADNTGVVDLSSELGGLKLVKLSQSEYDALSPDYDSNTLYIVTDS